MAIDGPEELDAQAPVRRWETLVYGRERTSALISARSATIDGVDWGSLGEWLLAVGFVLGMIYLLKIRRS